MIVDHYEYTGRGGRAENEDRAAHRCLPQGDVWVLADGVGGNGGGGEAAGLAVECFLSRMENGAGLRQAAEAANEALVRRQAQQAAGLPMACTLAAAQLRCDGLRWAHVGDSRFYLFRAGRLQAQTEDDSVCQKLVKLGELAPGEVRTSPDRNRLLHTLGEMASTSAAVRYLQRGRASSSSARHFCQISVPEASFRPSMKRSIFSLLMPARS